MSRRERIRYTVPTKIEPLANSAAVAAPLSSIAGKGPIPKMSSGSSTRLISAASTISMLGRRVSPVARMLAMPTMPTTTNGTPKYRILM